MIKQIQCLKDRRKKIYAISKEGIELLKERLMDEIVGSILNIKGIIIFLRKIAERDRDEKLLEWLEMLELGLNMGDFEGLVKWAESYAKEFASQYFEEYKWLLERASELEKRYLDLPSECKKCRYYNHCWRSLNAQANR